VGSEKKYRTLLEAMDDPEGIINDAKAKVRSLRSTFFKKKRDE
jgi:hypothetical protein